MSHRRRRGTASRRDCQSAGAAPHTGTASASRSAGSGDQQRGVVSMILWNARGRHKRRQGHRRPFAKPDHRSPKPEDGCPRRRRGARRRGGEASPVGFSDNAALAHAFRTTRRSRLPDAKVHWSRPIQRAATAAAQSHRQRRSTAQLFAAIRHREDTEPILETAPWKHADRQRRLALYSELEEALVHGRRLGKFYHASAAHLIRCTQSSFTRRSSATSPPSMTSRSIAEARPIHR